jgi:hypothetical protein
MGSGQAAKVMDLTSNRPGAAARNNSSYQAGLCPTAGWWELFFLDKVFFIVQRFTRDRESGCARTRQLAIGVGSGAQLLQPLAIAVIGGVAISMILSLLVTPVLFFKLRERGW